MGHDITPDIDLDIALEGCYEALAWQAERLGVVTQAWGRLAGLASNEDWLGGDWQQPHQAVEELRGLAARIERTTSLVVDIYMAAASRAD